MTYGDEGTAAGGGHIGLGDRVELGGAGLASGFLRVTPEDFTRDELRALLSKARALAQYGIFNDTKRDLLEDLVETLDLLDALVARDDLDLLELGETLRNDPYYVPYIRRAHPRPCQAPHESPRCGPHCQMRFIGEA